MGNIMLLAFSQRLARLSVAETATYHCYCMIYQRLSTSGKVSNMQLVPVHEWQEEKVGEVGLELTRLETIPCWNFTALEISAGIFLALELVDNSLWGSPVPRQGAEVDREQVSLQLPQLSLFVLFRCIRPEE
jgi:hypothetical protein